MAITPLPANANLENLRKRAKSLLKQVRNDDASALAQVGPYFGDPKTIGLQQAQLVIARSHGFSSWTKLKRHVEGMSDEGGDQMANQFLDLVTVAYGPVPDFGPKRFQQASALLDAHPGIATDSIYTAAAIGDVEGVEAWLDRDPDLVNRKGGFFGWEPLMYATYARLPGRSTLAAGRRLLERGADPNAFYMWGGQYRFTALTGVFGQGEGGPVNQPEHPDFVAFARALLDHGANPNDSQACYNRCFEPDNTYLELLLEYGLSIEDKNNWLVEDGDTLIPHPSETLHFQLIQAIKSGYSDRVRLLIDHGVDLRKPDDTYETRTEGKLPHEVAQLMGEVEIARMLRDAGAPTVVLGPEEALQVACMAGDVAQARDLLEENPSLLSDQLTADMLRDAVRRGNRAALRAMLDLGVNVNALHGTTALHEAALTGDVALAQMLLDAGANPTIRDMNYHATPMGYALHSEDADMIALFDGLEMDIFTAAVRGNLEQIRARLTEDPARIHLRFGEILPAKEKPENAWMTPLLFAVGADHADAVRLFLERGADLDAGDGAGQTVMLMAEEHASADILAILQRWRRVP
ncbi:MULTISPECIES: ankyrin repeat domain-containing protein [unclassified Roseovarius]|uniref:ankyrin repeat domain-containing protein n=1 Tax=unclassified Roseovarius TaxID=2614913 RepID=UPI00273FC16F|nr:MULTISPECIES: ankyrin repeat domain-containing protein [unclassified Roseovarius]